MIYVLYKNAHHDFSSLKDPTFIFGPDDIKQPICMQSIKAKLEEVLDQADLDEDYVVMNGPSYLSAIAGYIWLSRPDRDKYNFLAHDSADNTFKPHIENFTV